MTRPSMRADWVGGYFARCTKEKLSCLSAATIDRTRLDDRYSSAGGMKGGPNELEDNPDFSSVRDVDWLRRMSMRSPSDPPVMPLQSSMQSGQWEFTIASTDGSTNVYVESNLTAKPRGGISSNTTATALYWTQGGSADKLAALYVYCRGVQATFSTSGNNVIALLFEGTTQMAQSNSDSLR